MSSPDGLGDFLLRLPMLYALRDEGHRLQIFMRRPAGDLARDVLPDAEIHIIGADPYHPLTKCKTNPFRREHRMIRAFRPDIYVAALFHLNFFDQVWMERGRSNARVAGFSTKDSFRPAETTCDPEMLSQRFSQTVEVPVNLPEIEKNRRMASAILGKEVPLVAPSVASSPAALNEAQKILFAHGLAEGKFWITCVGTRPGLVMKDWGEENWIRFFSRAMAGERLVFVGNPKEAESIERIRRNLPDSVNLAGDPPAIATSLAICALSAGYVGRDSGIMHGAAAVGRRVFAVFGAGHWGRFLPVADRGVIVAQDWPCRGSNFHCPHDAPYCIREVPFDLALKGWSVLRDESFEGVKILEEPLDQGRLPEIARTASLEYARLAQELERTEFAARRPKNMLDAAGLKIRAWARGNV